MKKSVVFLLFVSACVLFTPSAWATWSFVTTGSTPGVGNPSCAAVSTNDVVCAVLSAKYTLMVNQFNGTTWGKWAGLAGAVSSAPSCTSDGTGKVICGANAGGSLLFTIFDGANWTKPAKVKAALYSAPSCAQYLAGEVLCVARNISGGLTSSLYNGTSWSAFDTLSTLAVSAPSCTTDNNSGVICAIFTTGSATIVNRFAAGAWQGFLTVGTNLAAGGVPDCVSLNSAGKVECYAKSYNTNIYGTGFNGTSWATSSWSSYGLVPNGVNTNENANCIAQSAGKQVCGVNAIDNAFYANIFNGTSWSAWSKVGGTGVGIPSCTPLGTGQVVCAIMGVDNRVTSAVGP